MANDLEKLADPFGVFGGGMGGGLSMDQTPLRGFLYDPAEDEANAMQGLNRGTKAYEDLSPVNYQDVNYVGPQEAADVRFDPAAIERMGPTAYNSVSVDPQYKAQQLAQLSALEELRNNGGLNLADKANLTKIANDEAAKEQSQRAAIMQNAQMRGMGGSNMALMAQLNASQQAANRQSMRDMEIAGMAQDRALNAGNSAANLAGNMSNQDFNQQSQIAAARDAAAKFNATIGNQGNQFNSTGNFNAARVNQGKTQGVNDATAIARNNSQTMNNYTMPTQNFNQSATRANGVAEVGKAQADYFGKKSDNAQKAQGGLWGGALGLGSKMLQGMDFSKMFSGDGDNATPATPSSSSPSSPQAQPFTDAGTYQDPAQPFTQNAPKNYVETRPSDPYAPTYKKPDNYVEMPTGYSRGGTVPGMPLVPGDSPVNDTVDARLSPGEIVIPRTAADEMRRQAQLAAIDSMRRRG